MFKRSANALAQSVRRFHNDEAGNETLQTVFITAIGALVMFGVYTLWDNDIRDWVQTSVNDLLSTDFTF